MKWTSFIHIFLINNVNTVSLIFKGLANNIIKINIFNLH